jgi:3-hydroxyisobutyrate dehydrogenase-like beta-hydroxyacid dehydrogenase
MTALPTEEAVEGVYSELSKEASAGQLYVDHSTVNPRLNRQCANKVQSKGASFLDAPVSGGPAGAQAGTLTIMVGGDQDAFERAVPLFRNLGEHIHFCGPVGAGQIVKLVNQLLVGVHTAAIAEATVFGLKLGAEPERLLEVIGTSFGASTMMVRNLPRFISRDFSPATPISIVEKDLGIIAETARAAAIPIPLTALVQQRFIEAKAYGLLEHDLAAVVRLWEEAARVVDGP